MAIYQKKQFFQEPTKARILKVSTINADNNLVDRIENLDENQALIIETRLISNNFPNSRKFLKHGPEVKPKRQYTLSQIAKERFVPVQLREQAFNGIGNKAYCGYSFIPFVGRDKRKRKVSLVECLEGARIFAYAHNIGTEIEFDPKPYDQSKRVESEGANIPVKVPSRRKKLSKYNFNLISVPVIDSPNKFVVSLGIASTGHDCKGKQYDFRYRYKDDKEGSDVFNFCGHEIAAYLKIIDHYWRKEKNIVPLEMSPFALPTMKTVDYYKRLCDSVLIRDETSKAKDQLRKLNKAEKEILLWGLVYKYNHDDTFFATEKIENYDWSLSKR